MHSAPIAGSIEASNDHIDLIIAHVYWATIIKGLPDYGYR